MPIARLTDRAVLSVSGKDAKPFLQGLITNDVAAVGPGRAVYAALLTPQGKVMFDFIIHADGDGYLLDVSALQGDEVFKRLKMYRLRAAVDLVTRDDLAVFAAWGDGISPDRLTDPRFAGLGQRWVEPATARHPEEPQGDVAKDAPSPLNAYHTHRLTLGVPDSADIVGEFLLDANGEELNAVDFRKGCFVGQEVTARMKHKAAPRKRMLPIVVPGALPEPGTIIDGNNGSVGDIRSGHGSRAIASIRLNRTEAGAWTGLGTSVMILRPAYPMLTYPPGADG